VGAGEGDREGEEDTEALGRPLPVLLLQGLEEAEREGEGLLLGCLLREAVPLLQAEGRGEAVSVPEADTVLQGLPDRVASPTEEVGEAVPLGLAVWLPVTEAVRRAVPDWLLDTAPELLPEPQAEAVPALLTVLFPVLAGLAEGVREAPGLPVTRALLLPPPPLLPLTHTVALGERLAVLDRVPLTEALGEALAHLEGVVDTLGDLEAAPEALLQGLLDLLRVPVTVGLPDLLPSTPPPPPLEALGLRVAEAEEQGLALALGQALALPDTLPLLLWLPLGVLLPQGVAVLLLHTLLLRVALAVLLRVTVPLALRVTLVVAVVLLLMLGVALGQRLPRAVAELQVLWLGEAVPLPLRVPVRQLLPVRLPVGQADRVLLPEGERQGVALALGLPLGEVERLGLGLLLVQSLVDTEGLLLPVPVPQALPVGVVPSPGLPLPLPLAEGQAEREWVALPLRLTLAQALRVLLPLAQALAEGLTDTLWLLLTTPVLLRVPVLSTLAVKVGEAVAQPEGLLGGLPLAQAVGVREGVGQEEGDTVPLLLWLLQALPVLLWEPLAEWLREGAPEALCVRVALAVGLEEAEGQGQGLALGVAVGQGLPLALRLPLAVLQPVPVGLGLPLPHTVPLPLLEGLREPVLQLLALWLRVSEAVPVAGCVGVGVPAALAVARALAVLERLGVREVEAQPEREGEPVADTVLLLLPLAASEPLLRGLGEGDRELRPEGVPEEEKLGEPVARGELLGLPEAVGHWLWLLQPLAVREPVAHPVELRQPLGVALPVGHTLAAEDMLRDTEPVRLRDCVRQPLTDRVGLRVIEGLPLLLGVEVLVAQVLAEEVGLAREGVLLPVEEAERESQEEEAEEDTLGEVEKLGEPEGEAVSDWQGLLD
jgi:hypothetical protein